MKGKLLLVLLLVLLLYMVLGALLFRYLESKPTAGQAINSTQAYNNFTLYLTSQYPCVAGVEEELMTDIINAYQAGTIDVPGAVEEDNWEFTKSLFFVSTVITTIGYGNTTPVTPAGQLSVIAYALVGIPICLIFLAGLGENLVKGLRKLESYFPACERCTTLCHILRVTFIISSGWVTFVMLPAWLFSYVEGWSYIKSIYYTFVTLSTIGFGDVVPSAVDGTHNPAYRVMSVVWVYVGLAWLSSVVAVLADIFAKAVAEGKAKFEETLKSQIEFAQKLKPFGGEHEDGSVKEEAGEVEEVTEAQDQTLLQNNVKERETEEETGTTSTSIGNTPVPV